MKNIKYISASAGSGKTHRLTLELTQAIKDGAVKPENVILTTFTKAAASEFKERAKAMLYENGFVLEADRLDQALIGTIHSVAESLILKYWYVLGLSPSINPIADEDLEFFKNQSLVKLLSYDDLDFLSDFAQEFEIKQFKSNKIDYDFWKRDLSQILEYAANYDIQDFSQSLEYSKKQADSLKKKGHHIKIDKDLLKQVLDMAEALNKATASDKQEQQGNEIRNQKRELEKDNDKSLKYAKSLKSFLGSLKFKDDEFDYARQKVMGGLDSLYATEEVNALLKKYIELMFRLARDWIDIYEKYKTEHHLIDFSDMEKKFCDLLQDKEVCEDIKATYKYVFVDEFQDCSPKQVRIFDRLSDIVEHSIWVGDKKQAIYGFRGSDTELTTAVMDIIAENKLKGLDGCETDILGDSWRSLPEIVEFTNNLFTKVFNKTTEEQKNEVCLKSQRTQDGQGHTGFWWLPQTKKEDRINQLAANIVDLINNGEKPEDIAVLARTNYDLEEIAKALREYEVPVFIDEGEQAQSNTVSLVTSILELIADETAELPKAEIAFLTEPDYKLGRILDNKLEFNKQAEEDTVFYNDIPLVQKIMKERKRYMLQSVSSMVQSLIIELDLYNIAKKFNDNTDPAKLLHAVIDTATEYEEHCALMNIPSSVTGFLAYIGENNISVSGSAQGVQLFTYHGSKGLEWKTVIIWGCDKEFLKSSDIVKHNLLGVKLIKMADVTKENLYPPVRISVLPYIFTGNTSVKDEWLTKITSTTDYNYQGLVKKETEETKRLMYVAMTRPRDKLIIALCGRRGEPLPLQLFTDFGFAVAKNFQNGSSDLFNTGVTSEKWENADLMIEYKKHDENNKILEIAKKSEKSVDNRDLTPSSMSGGNVEAEVIECGKPISVSGNYDAAELGTCIHDIFCVADHKNEAQITDMVKAYGFEANLPDSGEIKNAWEALTDWLNKTYGSAQKQYHELSFKHQLKNEQIVTGSMDFVWETEEGCVLIDFKTFPGKKKDLINPESSYYVGKYKGQLECYQNALVAAGKKVLAKLLYYPVVGVVVKF